ncbi:MAG: hypothetical protein KAJ33_04090 [Thermoplasmata archaeon]|nr:hypothetical protein [Thermoplasmata archaeon]MCK5397409.1 hypothetical protein [Thermoplasmata archaeon]
MCAKKRDDVDSDESIGEPMSGMEIDSQSMEDFVKDYLDAYREYLSNKDMDERHLPQFYKGFPFVVEIYALPNKAVCALFKKSNRSKFALQDGDFEEIMTKVRGKSFDFLQTFPPFTNFDEDEAQRLAEIDADRDLKASRRLELLGAAEAHIDEIHDDVKSLVELNPWLDQQTEAQKDKLDRAKELINELYREVDIDKDERFSDYSRQVMELMAFEKADMEEVASGLEIQLEEALEEMGERIFAVEDSMDSHEHDDVKSVGALENDLAELTKTVREMNLKLKDVANGDGASEEMEMELSKAQRQIKDSAKTISGIKKEIKSMQGDLAISKEIKETVFRDSKRAHNLNERTTELERDIKALKKETGKKGSSPSEIKAMEGKLNVLEKKLKDYTNKTVKREISKIPMPDPVPVVTTVTETIPQADGTVKKTTKKTTTKKTKKK